MTGIHVQTNEKAAFPNHREEAFRRRHDGAASVNNSSGETLAAADLLTRAELLFLHRRADYRLRFGAPDITRCLDKARALAMFKPGQVFGYLRWRADENGAEDWRFVIVKVRAPRRSVATADGVRGSGEALLSIAGAAKVRRALLQIDLLEAAGFDPAAVSPGFYRHLHDAIEKAEPVRAYSREEHEASLTKFRCG